MVAGWVPVFDQSFTRVPISRLHEMYDAGYRVMAGYRGGGTSNKWLTANEIAAWFALGDDTGIAALFEIKGTEPIDNPNSGFPHALSARAAWRLMGYPDDCSIAPAVDENVTIVEARAQLTEYFINWATGDTALPIPYVEMDAGAILFAEHISAGTFTPAAFAWDSSNKLIVPSNAPSHVVWTQEHNGRNMAGGNVDIGHIRVMANIQWKDNAMFTAADLHTMMTTHVLPATNPTESLGTAILGTQNGVAALRTEIDDLKSVVATLAASVAKIPITALPSAPIDVTALAAAIVAATPPVHGTFIETE